MLFHYGKNILKLKKIIIKTSTSDFTDITEIETLVSYITFYADILP